MQHCANTAKEVKLKTRLQLQDVLKRTQDLLAHLGLTKTHEELHRDEIYEKVSQVADVLGRWPITGINRKLQLKPIEFDESNPDKKNTSGHQSAPRVEVGW